MTALIFIDMLSCLHPPNVKLIIDADAKRSIEGLGVGLLGSVVDPMSTFDVSATYTKTRISCEIGCIFARDT